MIDYQKWFLSKRAVCSYLQRDKAVVDIFYKKSPVS